MGGFIYTFLISIGIWCIRFKYDRQGVQNDFKWMFLCLLWLCRHTLYSGIVRNSAASWIAAITTLFGVALYHLISHLFSNKISLSQYEDTGKKTEAEAEAKKPNFSHLKPLILPCRTSHTRMFPKIHSFSYSYLFVGIPVGWQGSLGKLVSADLECHSAGCEADRAYRQKQNAWFTVESAEYLNRGGQARGLKGKLDDYLRSQVCKFSCFKFSTELKSIYRVKPLRIILILIWSPRLAFSGILSTLCRSGICTTREKS